jgi:hypothetical protein
LYSAILIIVPVFVVLGLLLGFADQAQKETGTGLTLVTDKKEYSQGETVVFVATNHGDRKLLFAYGSLQLTLNNLDTDKSYDVISGQVFDSLEQGKSKTIVWNEKRDGRLEPGSYIAAIKTTQAGGYPVITAQTDFKVS